MIEININIENGNRLPNMKKNLKQILENLVIYFDIKKQIITRYFNCE